MYITPAELRNDQIEWEWQGHILPTFAVYKAAWADAQPDYANGYMGFNAATMPSTYRMWTRERSYAAALHGAVAAQFEETLQELAQRVDQALQNGGPIPNGVTNRILVREQQRHAWNRRKRANKQIKRKPKHVYRTPRERNIRKKYSRK
jgi:hypothetical protein